MIQIKKGTIIHTPLVKAVVTRIMVEIKPDDLPPVTHIKLRVFESEDPEMPPAATVNLTSVGLAARFERANWKIG